MKKTLARELFVLLLNIPWILAFIIAPPTEYQSEVEVVEEEPIIRWKQEEMYEEALEVTVEEVKVNETKEPEKKSLGEFRITAYCPCESCSGPHGYQTSTGAVVTEGRTVAVDPTVIPYGTVLMIDGYEMEYVAEDCGSAIKGNDIDIFFESHEEADKFGVKYMEVFIWQ